MPNVVVISPVFNILIHLVKLTSLCSEPIHIHTPLRPNNVTLGIERALRGRVLPSFSMKCEEIYYRYYKEMSYVHSKRIAQYWNKLGYIYKGHRLLEVNTADRDEHIGARVKHSSQEA